jgi:hypothetical protein
MLSLPRSPARMQRLDSLAHSLCDQQLLTPGKTQFGTTTCHSQTHYCITTFPLPFPIPLYIPSSSTSSPITLSPRPFQSHAHINPSNTPTVLRHHTYQQSNPPLIPTSPSPARLFDDRRVVNQTCSRALFEVSWYVQSQCARECAANTNSITRHPTNSLSSPLFNLKGHSIT